MNIKRRYKNMVESFLSKDTGKRFFQVFYSLGAAVIIVGVLAKLMHWPHGLGNTLLYVGFITEAIVFIISAFDKPTKEYPWEAVFPILDSNDEEDRPVFGSGSGVVVGGTSSTPTEGVYPVGGMKGGVSGTVVVGGGGGYAGAYPGGAVPPLSEDVVKKSFGIPSNVNITEEDTNALTASIRKLSGAAEQLSKMSDLADVTQEYLSRMSEISENMLKFSNVTSNLTEVSDVLLNSYKSITDNSEDITENSKGYIQQMEALNHNIANLNNMYEIQVHSVNSQMEAVSRINAGLLRIKDMYEGSVVDSSVFRGETEKMTQHIAALNNVYARLLNAMTMNMNMQQGGGFGPNQGYYSNPGYNNPGYGGNPGNYNPGYNPPPAGNYNPPPSPGGNQNNPPATENGEKKS